MLLHHSEEDNIMNKLNISVTKKCTFHHFPFAITPLIGNFASVIVKGSMHKSSFCPACPRLDTAAKKAFSTKT